MSFDTLIVGSGPAGCLTALELREHNVMLIEEHSSAGFPVQCAGLISQDCFNEYLAYTSKIKKSLIKKVDGAIFFSPNGKFVELEGKSKGVVIERKIFDRILLAEASNYVDVLMKTKFDPSMIKNFDYVIGADGVYSAVSRYFNFKRPQVYLAVQFECRFECLDDNMVELYFGKSYSDGFFAYAIPIDGFARIGVVSKTDPMFYLNTLLKKHPSVSRRVHSNKITELNVGAIPIGLVEFVRGNVALIGDSAGMTKPYTGGGLFYLLKAAKILGKSFPDLDNYLRQYLNLMKKEYEFGMKILKLYSGLRDDEFNELVRIGAEYDLKSKMRELNMDEPSTILNVLPLLPKFLRNFRLAVKILRTML